MQPMGKDNQEIKYLYFRETYNGEPSKHGGIVIGIEQHTYNSYGCAAAFCSDKDVFNKKVAKALIKERLKQDHWVCTGYVDVMTMLYTFITTDKAGRSWRKLLNSRKGLSLLYGDPDSWLESYIIVADDMINVKDIKKLTIGGVMKGRSK